MALSFAEAGDDKDDDLIAKEKQKEGKEKEKQKWAKYLSSYARSFQMLKDKKPLENVIYNLI